MKKTFLEQLMLSTDVGHQVAPMVPLNTLDEQKPATNKFTQPEQKPVGQKTTNKFALAMAPANQSNPEAQLGETQPDDKMSYLERMRINSKVKGVMGDATT